MKRVFLLAFTMVLFGITAFGQKKTDFRATLEKHLGAVAAKNIDVIAATVADSVTLIFPDGEVLQSKQKFIDFHKDWFKDTAWKMTTEILKATEGGALSYGLIKYQYTKLNGDGSIKTQSNAYLMLIFEKQKDGWKLIHDQNTKITL
jgi:ketosteroid isomerase-like protein